MSQSINIRALLALMVLIGTAAAFRTEVSRAQARPSVHTGVDSRGLAGSAGSGSLDVFNTGDGSYLENFCGTDTHSRAARDAALAFIAARDTGTLVRARKGMNPPQIGDEQNFNVIEGSWTSKTFRLMDVTNLYQLWVEIGEIENGNMSQLEVDALRGVMHDHTPQGSIDPNRGIIANDEAIFGDPPDFDGDGLVDLLLYDIGSGTSTTTTLGYVTSQDVNPSAPDSVGNQRDVLYLDSNEGSRNLSTLAAVAAHEYTHLLNISTGFADFTFLSEGYAEYAIVLNGYTGFRGIEYLNDPTEYQRPFFDWRDGGGPFARDYQRGNLFFGYVAEQHSPETVGRMLKERGYPGSKGSDGLDTVLATEGTTLAETLRDFHTANLINDVSMDPRFGHSYVERQNLSAPITRMISGEVMGRDGEISGFFTRVPNLELKAGSVRYIQWTDVSDFSLVLDALGYEVFPVNIREQFRILMQARVQPRLIGTRPDGSQEIFDIIASQDPYQFSGPFTSLTMVLAHVDPDVSGKIKYLADWTPRSQATDTEAPAELPGAVTLEQNYPNPFSASTSIPFTVGRTGAVRLSIFDLLGRERMVLIDKTLPVGHHEARLETEGWASGLYIVRLEANNRVETKRIMLVR